MSSKGSLVLADGYVFSGEIENAPLEPWTGELVFSTAMTGYTEILSDPSFFNQMVILSNAEIGNYGVNFDDMQSANIKAKALIVRNFTHESFSWREHCSLATWLQKENIPVFWGADTRALISHLRTKGCMMASLGSERFSKEVLLNAARSAPSMAGQRLSPMVSVQKNEHFTQEQAPCAQTSASDRIVVIDFGVKREILRLLKRQHEDVVVVPSSISEAELWALKPDGICLSNGPGDPETEKAAVLLVKALLGKLPIFGICLGHQILAQALGYSTYKLKCGHRGSNQPVLTAEAKVIITAQNHGFAVFEHDAEIGVDHNLMDATNEGIHLPHLYAFSVQFHPEGAPGPHDAAGYFSMFKDMITAWKTAQFTDSVPTRCSLL